MYGCSINKRLSEINECITNLLGIGCYFKWSFCMQNQKVWSYNLTISVYGAT